MPAHAEHVLTRSFLDESGWSDNTKRVAVSCLNRWQRWLAERDVELLDATTELARTYLQERTDAGVDGSTNKVDWRMLSRFYSWAHDEGERSQTTRKRVKSIMRKIPPPHVRDDKRQKVITESEFKALLRTCDTSTTRGRRDAAILLTLWWGGMRRSELTNLNLDDADVRESLLDVYATKTNKLRSIGVHDEVKTALTRYLRSRGTDDGPLFLSERGDTLEERRLRPNSVQLMLNRRARAAKLDRVIGCHEFRRSWAIRAKLAGMSDSEVMAHCGWSNLVMLNNYTRPQRDEIARNAFARTMGKQRTTSRRLRAVS